MPQISSQQHLPMGLYCHKSTKMSKQSRHNSSTNSDNPTLRKGQTEAAAPGVDDTVCHLLHAHKYDEILKVE